MPEYRTHDVPVRGGQLRVGAWRGDGPVRRTVLAVHGITASHRAWTMVAERIPAGTLLLAPDLRGRGRSGALPGPWGMAGHAADCVRVLDELAGGHCDLAAGHSMGAFVTVMLAARHPDTLDELVLVDGGIPLPLPPGVSRDEALTVTLGPAAARLRTEFPDRAAYLDFWRAHPAFVDDWSDAVADYAEYDLAPHGPPWRSSCSIEAMTADHGELLTGGPVDDAWGDVSTTATLLRAPRGLLNEPTALYPHEILDPWLAAHPGVALREVDDVNHYTITMGRRGADVVAAALG